MLPTPTGHGRGVWLFVSLLDYNPTPTGHVRGVWLFVSLLDYNVS